MIPEQREKLITKLIMNVSESAFQDDDFRDEFIDDAMRNGYRALPEMTDEELLQMHRDVFDEEYQAAGFKPEEGEG